MRVGRLKAANPGATFYGPDAEQAGAGVTPLQNGDGRRLTATRRCGKSPGPVAEHCAPSYDLAAVQFRNPRPPFSLRRQPPLPHRPYPWDRPRNPLAAAPPRPEYREAAAATCQDRPWD